MSSRIALGTVQFGLTYGVANDTGQVGRDEAATILVHARAAGLDTLDTAISYGDSEQRLGEIGVDGWRVVSKLPAAPVEATDLSQWVLESVRGSLSRLGTSRLYGLLLHRPQELLGPRAAEVHGALVAVRERGLVTKIGVSIYDPEELETLWGSFEFDLVQAPFNIFDRRLATSGWLGRLRDAAVEVHTRSAFLQGLLLMTPSRRPARFANWVDLWRRWDQWLAGSDRTALQTCLGFVLAHPEIDRVVVGVDRAAHLDEIVVAAQVPAGEYPGEFESTDLELISPARWRTE